MKRREASRSAPVERRWDAAMVVDGVRKRGWVGFEAPSWFVARAMAMVEFQCGPDHCKVVPYVSEAVSR